MLNKTSSFVSDLMQKGLSETVQTRDQILELGSLARQELHKSVALISRKDPRGAKHTLLKSCWYLDKLVKSIEETSGVTLEKSAAQSNSVKDKIESSSDWVNTIKESSTYDVLSECSEAMQTAIDTLLSFAKNMTDDVKVNKDRCATVSEKMIYKAYNKA